MTQSRFIGWFLLISLISLFACSQQLSSAIPMLSTATPTRGSATAGPTDAARPACRPYDQKDFDDPGGFICRACDLLVHSGLEKGFSPDYAHSAPVTFPSGDKGALVSIGFFGPTHGYLVLLRLQGDSMEPLEIAQSDYDWGVVTGLGYYLEETDIESLPFFYSPNDRPRDVFKISGWSDMGSGTGSDAFQIVDVTDGRIRIIFTGLLDADAANNGGYYKEYGYDYADLDGDGDQEITQTGRECQVQFVREPAGISDCVPVRRVYKYNGTEYSHLP